MTTSSNTPETENSQTDNSSDQQGYNSLEEFYPFYLSQHQDLNCRRLHLVGSSQALICFVAALVTLNGWYILLGVFLGYGFAWVGHFFFEKNKPATFEYPLYSFLCDWIMLKDMLTGRIKI